MTGDHQIGFWDWLRWGSGSKPGWRRIINRRSLVDLALGALLMTVLPLPLKDAANSVLTPILGVIIGLTFAWAGNAQGLLQTREVAKITEEHPGGFVEYVFTYQASILVLMVTLVAWALAGFGIFDTVWPGKESRALYLIIGSVLMGLLSTAVRSSWSVVLGASWLLRYKRAAEELQDSAKRCQESGNTP